MGQGYRRLKMAERVVGLLILGWLVYMMWR